MSIRDFDNPAGEALAPAERFWGVGGGAGKQDGKGIGVVFRGEGLGRGACFASPSPASAF